MNTNMQTQEIAIVTGANGFVGSHLVDNLLSKGLKIRCIVRKSSNLKWLDGKNVEIYDSGLFDKDGLRKLFKDANYIYHVAGVVKSKTAEGFYRGNVDSTKNLLEVAL
jgi:nucleoside-diphosphate-sugar epimerase